MTNLCKKKQTNWSYEVNLEALQMWESAIRYGVRISKIVRNFPEDIHHQLDSRVQFSAIAISNNIAKGANSESKGDFQDSLLDAIDSVYGAVSGLFIAYQWNYLRSDLYTRIHQDGEYLVKKLQQFCTVI